MRKATKNKKRGRPAIGKKAMTAAERQAKYREKLKEKAKLLDIRIAVIDMKLNHNCTVDQLSHEEQVLLLARHYGFI